MRGGPNDGRLFEDDLDGVEVTNVPAVYNVEPEQIVLDNEEVQLVTIWHRYVYDHTDNDVAVFRYDGETT